MADLAVEHRGALRLGSEIGTAPTFFLPTVDFPMRYFGLIKFDESPTNTSAKTKVKIAAPEDADTQPEPVYVLVWFDGEGSFEKWLKSLSAGSMPGTAKMRTPGMVLDKLAVSDCMGWITVRSISAVRESPRLDLPNLAAVDVVTSSRTILLANESKEAIIEWEEALTSRMEERITARKNRASVAGRKSVAFAEGSVAGRISRSINRMTMREPSRTPARVQTLNKWKQDVSTTLYRILAVLMMLWTLGWLFGLIFLMNPYMGRCGSNVYYDGGATLQCYTDTPNGPFPATGNCVPWRVSSRLMGPAMNWVDVLAKNNVPLFEATITGNRQTCFREPDTAALVIFWLFVAVEILGGISSNANNILNWRVISRGAKTLNKLRPHLPTKDWPSIDILICHYSEEAEETVATLNKCLELEYPPDKVHVYICDDGRLKGDFKDVSESGPVYWPAVKLNNGCIKQAGDVRAFVAEYMADRAASSSDPSKAAPLVREVFPDPSKKECAVHRPDCAVGYIEDLYEVPGVAAVSYVARLKPIVHHSKSGNINNVLYNVQSDRRFEGDQGSNPGRYVAIFDNDMEPHPKFLISLVPLFFERLDEHGKAHRDSMLSAPEDAGDKTKFDAVDKPPPAVTTKNGWTDHPEKNKIAFVQTPQYFKTHELVADFADPLAHQNSIFMDVALPGMDARDCAMFIGTNVLWRREALDSIGGLQYGTISEDFWTGRTAHNLGWYSGYMRKDVMGVEEERFRLAEGTVPPNVAASLAQRKRWHKGGVELLLGVNNPKDPSWTPPEAFKPNWKVPLKNRLFRKFHWYYTTLLGWIIVPVPPAIYTFIAVWGCWTDTLFFTLNAGAVAIFMLPRLFLSSTVYTLANPNVAPESYNGGVNEFFVYWPVKLLGTLEAFYSKCTGLPAKWGNTGGIGAGSSEEIPVVIITIILIVSIMYSIIRWAFVETNQELYTVIPIWAFTAFQLNVYYPVARTSFKEYFGYSYKSSWSRITGRTLYLWSFSTIIMGITILLMLRTNNYTTFWETS